MSSDEPSTSASAGATSSPISPEKPPGVKARSQLWKEQNRIRYNDYQKRYMRQYRAKQARDRQQREDKRAQEQADE